MQLDIKVILWDIDRTLLDFEASETYAIRKCFSIFGLGRCTDDMIKSYSEINKKYWHRLEREEITKKQVLEGRFQEFFERQGIDVSKAASFNLEYQKRLGDTIVFCENGLEIVKKLKGNILQYAVTNGTKIAQQRKMKNSGLDRLLDGIYISEDVGVEKPGIGFFEEVFRTIPVSDKRQIMIVGDSLTSDIQGGINAGIITCWYNPHRQKNDTQIKPDYEIEHLLDLLQMLF